MKLPLSLLRHYLEWDEPLSLLSETLTLLGIEVDGIEHERPGFAHVIAATVVAAKPHPASERMQVADVFDGAKHWQVVCGAPNCRAGLKTAFAKAGSAILFNSEGELRIEEASIRGVSSCGMLCSAHELGVPGDDKGILELPKEIEDGQDLARILWDPVLELSLTPNLGHCMSALGIARELSAALSKPLKHHRPHVKEHPPQIKETIRAAIREPASCPSYLCRAIDGIQVGPSPFWLQQTLLAAGMRSINNIVDAANYIMLKTGQPLHAFDAAKIEGNALYVQTNEAPQRFLGLDEIERELPTGTLLICDERKALAIAGVLGGANSSVSDNTRSIVLEAALFDPIHVRKTARALGLRTESSQRFEKGIDSHGIAAALDEAAALIAECSGGSVRAGRIEEHGKAIKERTIQIRVEKTNALLGTKLSLGEIEGILQRAFCKTMVEEGSLRAIVPSYRNDLREEIDLIEEVARIYGYNNIETSAPLCHLATIPLDPTYVFERCIRTRMAAQGLQEILTCDLISPKLSELVPSEGLIHVLHAKNEDYSILRPSLLPGALEVVRTNLDQKNPSLSCFEIGKVHFRHESKFIPNITQDLAADAFRNPRFAAGEAGAGAGHVKNMADGRGCKDGVSKCVSGQILSDVRYIEVPMLSIVLYGKSRPLHWERKAAEVDFYDLLGIVESLMEVLSIPMSAKTSAHACFHPGRQAGIYVEGLAVGSMGEIHPRLLAKMDIKQRVLFAELDLKHLMELRSKDVKMKPLSLFPSTERDWTIPLTKGTSYQTLCNAIHSFKSKLLEGARLIDLYQFEQDGEKKQTATFRFVYRDLYKTISYEEAEEAHAQLMGHVNSCISSNA